MMIQAAVTMNQLQKKHDIIGNNIANAETTGYKARKTEFSSLLFDQINNLSDLANQQGRLTPDGIRVGSGARLGATHFNLSEGHMIKTDRSLDTALVDSNMLFEIQVTENEVTETRYTRDGAFYINPMNDDQVMLTTVDGHPVLGRNGNPIVFSSEFDNIDISETGMVTIQQGNLTFSIGEINVVTANRPRLLEAIGANQFRLPNLEQLGMVESDIIQDTAPGLEVLQSHTLERSNVQLAEEMTELIMTQRAFEFNARTISMADQMSGLINQLR